MACFSPKKVTRTARWGPQDEAIRLPGILIAVVLSLLDVARRSSAPHTAILVQVPDTDTFRDIDHVEGRETVPGLLINRFGAPLFFANVSVMTDELSDLVAIAEPPFQWILIDAESIHDMDTTAVQDPEELIEDLHEAGIVLAFARMRNAECRSCDHDLRWSHRSDR